MEEYLSSSEAFAKALKGFQTSPSEKIRLAKEAWKRLDVVLPHKQEFLLEWLCSGLVKSSTPSKNPKDQSPNNGVILDQEYWDLFKDMLAGITSSRNKHRKYGLVNAWHHDGSHGLGSGVANNQAPAVLLRVPVIPIFTALIQRLGPQSPPPAAAAIAADSTASTKPRKKTKALAKPTPSQALPSLDAPSSAVLQSASTCFELLSSPTMSEWFQPTLEQYTPLVQATLEALVEVTCESSTTGDDHQLIMIGFAHIVLDRFRRLVVIQPNQKKVFALVAGKMFEVLVRARAVLRKVPVASAVECQEDIGAILKTGLFHQEHLQEYTAGYFSGDEKSIQSYQKQLFEQIAILIKSEHSTAVLDILPLLLRYFVEESRRKQKSLANSGFERGMESARETEFSFFKIIYVLAKKQLPHLTGDPSETSIGELANIMDAHNHLLATILELNMYQPSNDEAADQFVFMSTSFGSVYACLTTAQTLSNGRLQSISLTGIVVLAQLDDRLLKPHLDSLWPVLFSPLPEASGAALELAKTLLEIYGKASDLGIFLNSLFSSLRGYLARPEELDSSPLFSKAFLDLIPTNIRNYLPLPQAPEILNIFVTELMALDSSMETEELELVQQSTHKKKRKLNSGKSKEYAEESSAVPSAEPLTTIFVQYLKGLRVTANQEKQLNKEFKVLYDHFLRQIFESLTGADGHVEKSGSYQARRLTPALKLHYALCRISTQYWTSGISMDLMEKIVATFNSTSKWADATVLMLNRVILQHIHLTLCSTGRMDDNLTQRCRDLVRFTMKSSRLERLLEDGSLVSETWDGRLESASRNSFLVASWQIQVNDWLDIVCRFSTTQHMELIAQVITRQFSTPSNDSATASSNTITIYLLNQVLLRSANFYEVPNFRPIFAQTLLQRLSESIIALSETESERKLAAAVASFTESAESFKDTSSRTSFSDALKELAKVSQQQAGEKKSKSKSRSRSTAAEEHGPRLQSLLSIVHLLPLEYFEKYERNIILTTMAVLDHYIQRYLVADSTGIKCLLLERRISSAIMTWRSDAGVLLNDPSILTSLLNYPAWNCSTSYGSEDKDRLGYALMNTTCTMIDSAIRCYMVQIYDTIQYESAFEHLDALLEAAQEWAGASLEGSAAVLDNRINEPKIKTIMISQVCRSLVHCLEQHRHQRSKSKSNSKTISGNAAANIDRKFASLLKQIGELYETVQSKTTVRISRVISLLKPESKNNNGRHRISNMAGVIEEAQKCMDHFELYRTIVQYRQLDSEQDTTAYLELMPNLFLLAQALVQVISTRGQDDIQDGLITSESLVHLATVLTGYSCQYLPLAKAWQSTPDGVEKTLKELLEMLLAISGQELQERDIVSLKDAYLSLLGLISGDLFDTTLNWLLEEAHSSGDQAADEIVLVRFLDITFLGAHHTQKRKVRRQISKLLTKLIQILQSTQSVQVIVGVLDIMAGICAEPSFELRTWEIGLVLEGVTSLMSPATPLLLGGVKSRSSSIARPLTNQDTSKIFTALYHVLINVARYKQEELTTLIPVFTAILQGIFHGFKSLHASIAKRQQGVELLIKSPFMLLSAGALHPAAPIPGSSTVSGAPIGDPLPVECAENFARLLTALGSRGVSTTFGSHGGGGAGAGSNATLNGHISATPTLSPGSSTITTDTSKAFGKHAPYILMEYFTIQGSVVASISQQSLRNALLPGLYALLNLCSDWEREMMMIGLDNTGKMLLKGLYTDYLRHHKYTGR